MLANKLKPVLDRDRWGWSQRHVDFELYKKPPLYLPLPPLPARKPATGKLALLCTKPPATAGKWSSGPLGSFSTGCWFSTYSHPLWVRKPGFKMALVESARCRPGAQGTWVLGLCVGCGLYAFGQVSLFLAWFLGYKMRDQKVV